MFCLVRTSDEGKRQEGISFLLVDMNQPGVTVQPIKTIDGSTEVNNVFLEDVKVPVENRVEKKIKVGRMLNICWDMRELVLLLSGGQKRKLRD